ncbi:ribonuclease H-like protein [Metschnikowia bicuspidata var. bicuspidata NRRL YB-4993]|uniref:RNA exonuclease 3 n=1 Tax=Metschnikowia bicuspidata var. bicuspidata NRRL YB-4993 TaxID=869754 RepID=A0A1A0H1W7_9ASCO|nr:ribonuclease H-like protein [Metschnikowia bicuspidata var. bicuspidata NRRL YB-4993]OBA18024.1 ribonuclease H-like protein [Metschnikowia bicuspidata var. bicuspidata NRRL YB-4993]
MFKLPSNAFANVKCPSLEQTGCCNIPNCFFRHDLAKRALEKTEESHKRAKSDASIASANPVRKDILFVLPKELHSEVLIPRIERSENAKAIARLMHSTKSTPTPNRLAVEKEFKIASECVNLGDYRKRINTFLGVKHDHSHATDPKHIFPLDVNHSPALLPVRRKFIQLFVDAIKTQNPSMETPVWAAIEEEFKVASSNSSSTYSWAVKRKLYEMNHPEKLKKPASRVPSRDEYLRELRNLCIPREKLKKWGFIMDIPAAIDAPEPVRHCNRCKMEFKLEESSKAVDCRYHQGRLIKNDHKVRVYLCCGGVFGETDTEPCTKGEHHVFYWTSPEEMHHFLPFIETKHAWGTRKGSLDAVGIDCEMGFTTQGFELLRITAIDFSSGEEVLDILVRPKGKVLDLNTRWSGVAEIKEEALSFEDLITLLGEIVDANTVMIGHGLENDMNAMRLIHENIVDTAVLYPKYKTSPTFRFSLKQLSFQYLGRAIQAGEHDSGEDSLAAIDVTKYFIKQDLERAWNGHS